MCAYLLLCPSPPAKAVPLANWVALDKSMHVLPYSVAGTVMGAENAGVNETKLLFSRSHLRRFVS